MIVGVLLFALVAFGLIVFLAKRNAARTDDKKVDNG
jgi:hypothetical protein